jgi:hypothetical protein
MRVLQTRKLEERRGEGYMPSSNLNLDKRLWGAADTRSVGARSLRSN